MGAHEAKWFILEISAVAILSLAAGIYIGEGRQSSVQTITPTSSLDMCKYPPASQWESIAGNPSLSYVLVGSEHLVGYTYGWPVIHNATHYINRNGPITTYTVYDSFLKKNFSWVQRAETELPAIINGTFVWHPELTLIDGLELSWKCPE